MGDFRTAGGAPHAAVAFIDKVTGGVLSWRPPAAEAAQYAAASLGASTTVVAFDGYVGGNADTINAYRLMRVRS